MEPAPIVVCVYARPDYLKRTLGSLAKNPMAKESVLYAFCDGPKVEAHREACEAARKVAESAAGFKDVVVKKFDINRGPGISTVESVTEVVNKHGRCVVVEEDIESTPHFLTFINEGLERFRDEQKVFSVCGYSPPMRGIPADYPFDCFFSLRTMSWGWSTWADRWAKADYEIKDLEAFKRDRALQSRFNEGGPDRSELLIGAMEGRYVTWDIQWDYTMFRHGGVSLLPVYSLLQNFGTDDSGTNFKGGTEKFDVDLSKAKSIEKWPDRVYVDPRLAKAFRACYGKSLARGVKKAVRILKRTIPGKK